MKGGKEEIRIDRSCCGVPKLAHETTGTRFLVGEA